MPIGGPLASVDLSAPLADTLATLLAQGAAALGVPAPSPLRAALALVAVTSGLLGIATLRPPLPRFAWRRRAAPAVHDTRLDRTRAMTAAGYPATEIARATGLSRDAIAILRHLPAA